MGRARTFQSLTGRLNLVAHFAPSLGHNMKIFPRGLGAGEPFVPFDPEEEGLDVTTLLERDVLHAAHSRRTSPDALCVWARGEEDRWHDWLVEHPESARWYRQARPPVKLYASRRSLVFDPYFTAALTTTLPTAHGRLLLHASGDLSEAPTFEYYAEHRPHHNARERGHVWARSTRLMDRVVVYYERRETWYDYRTYPHTQGS